MGNIEGFIGKPGQRSLGQGDDLDRHVDADHEHGPVNHIFNMIDIAHDVRSFADASTGRGKTDRQIRWNRRLFFGLLRLAF